MEPWIKLCRKFKDWEWYGDVIVMAVFIELLLSANWKPTKWKGITLDIGETVIGRKALAEKFNVSEQQIRTALDKLEKSQVINRKVTNRYTVVKVLKYCYYQGFDFAEQPTSNQQITNNQPTNNQQITTPKETKNIRNIYEEENIARTREDFAKLFKLYDENIGRVSSVVKEVITDLLSSYSADLIELAIREAAKANAHSINYVESIFRDWEYAGVKNLQDAKHAVAEHHRKKLNAVSAKKGQSNDRDKRAVKEPERKLGIHL